MACLGKRKRNFDKTEMKEFLEETEIETGTDNFIDMWDSAPCTTRRIHIMCATQHIVPLSDVKVLRAIVCSASPASNERSYFHMHQFGCPFGNVLRKIPNDRLYKGSASSYLPCCLYRLARLPRVVAT